MELRRRLPAHYFQPVSVRALWMLPYIMVACAGAWLILSGHLSILARIAVSITIALAYSGIMMLGHEILHGAVVRRAWARELLGAISLLPLAVSPRVWHLWHNVAHHTNTQIPGRDPDAYSTLENYQQRRALRILHRLVPVKSLLFFALLAVWFSVHSIIILTHALPQLARRNRIIVLAEVAAGYLFWIGVAVVVGWRHFIFIYVLPFFMTNFVVMSHIATNHLLNPLMEDNDPLAGSLSLRDPKFLDVLLSNFSHHTEHHVFPAMSARYLPHVRCLLKELWPERYHEMSLWDAVATLWKTPRLYLNNIRLIDPVSGETYGVLGHGLTPGRVQEQR